MEAKEPTIAISNQGAFSIVEALNYFIHNEPKVDTNLISDGYHTFGELYDHRITLYIQLCKARFLDPDNGFLHGVWKSKTHSDGSVWDGWFILGIFKEPGKQITYHLPMDRWEDCKFAETLDKAPEWDGHTSADVLQRLKNL